MGELSPLYHSGAQSFTVELCKIILWKYWVIVGFSDEVMMQIYRIKRGLVREIIEDFPEMKAFLQSIPICNVNRDIKVSMESAWKDSFIYSNKSYTLQSVAVM